MVRTVTITDIPLKMKVEKSVFINNADFSVNIDFIITEKTGDEPILLLDDVLAELDDIRQNYLLKSITNATQTIITSVDTVLFEEEFLKDVKIYKIENGALK